MEPQISQLFDTTRFPRGASLVAIILYLPIGIVLSVLRFFIILHIFVISKLLPKATPLRSYILRAMCAVIGLFITLDDRQQSRSRPAAILVSNHVSFVDHLIIGLLIDNMTLSPKGMPSGLQWILDYTDMGQDKGLDALLENVEQHCNKAAVPVLLFPECATTNGSVGLLSFNDWVFSLRKPIQPITLKISRSSIFPISVSPVGSRWWVDLYWFAFSPYTVFSVTLLPTITPNENETTEAYCRRTEQVIAQTLSLAQTSYTEVDKHEFVKKFLQEQKQKKLKNLDRTSDERTANHQKSEESISNVADDSSQWETDFLCSNTLVFGAKEFSKHANSRQLSFHDRKQLMIKTARFRYKQKHGLC